MQILAIHSNKIFFEGTIEEAVPDFYQWLSRERGLNKEFIKLDSEYDDKKNTPLLLREIYKLAVYGLSKEELFAYCGKYNEFYFNKKLYGRLAKIREMMEILILTSYPSELFEHLISNGSADKIFGAEGKFNNEGDIFDLKEIELKFPEEVIEKMKKIGFGFEFTLEPDRYGLLELLIDYMLEIGADKNNVTVIGKNTASMPFSRVSGKQLDSLP
ncbi:MAG: hypothetical protein V1860_02305 [bacterium]